MGSKQIEKQQDTFKKDIVTRHPQSVELEQVKQIFEDDYQRDPNIIAQILYLRKLCKSAQKKEQAKVFSKFGLGMCKYEILINLAKQECVHYVHGTENFISLFWIKQFKYQKFTVPGILPEFSSSIYWKSSIYLVGGMKNGKTIDEVQEINVKYNRIRDLSPLSTPRNRSALVIFKDVLLFAIGGFKSKSLNTVEVLHLKNSRSWEKRSDLNEQRGVCNAVSTRNFIYTFGGWNAKKWFNTIEKYIPQNDQWILLETKLPLPLQSMSLIQNPIMLFGGIHNAEPVDKAYCWEDGQWFISGNIPEKVYSLQVQGKKFAEYAYCWVYNEEKNKIEVVRVHIFNFKFSTLHILEAKAMV